MQGIQPQTLTNDELERMVYITGPDKLPKNWVEEVLRRTLADWRETNPKDPAQLKLDFS
jgi:hypothetical protein